MLNAPNIVKNTMFDSEEYATDDYDTIIKHLQTGGGSVVRTQSYPRTRTQILINTIINLGWDPDYITNALRHLDDQMLTEFPARIFIEEYFKALIRRQGLTVQLKNLCYA